MNLPGAALYLLAALADEDGWLHATVFEYPDPHPQTGQHCMDYSLLYGVTLYEYLKATGDRETAEDLWPVVVRQIEFARTYPQRRHLRHGQETAMVACFRLERRP